MRAANTYRIEAGAGRLIRNLRLHLPGPEGENQCLPTEVRGSDGAVVHRTERALVLCNFGSIELPLRPMAVEPV